MRHDKEHRPEQDFTEESWDKKRIVIGIIAVLLVGFLLGQAKQFIDVSELFSTPRRDVVTDNVAGASTQESSKTVTVKPPQFDVQEKLEDLAAEAAKLEVEEVATSSPQVQKVLKDVQALQNYPKNQAREMCENICKQL